MRIFQRFLRSLGRSLLLGCTEEDSGTVLRAPVRALAVELRGVVVLPENFQQIGVATWAGSKSTSTASAWPVPSVQTSL